MSLYYLKYDATGDRLVGEYDGVLRKGDKVIGKTMFGDDVLEVLSACEPDRNPDGAGKIHRHATESEIEIVRGGAERKEDYLRETNREAAELGLKMKAVKAHVMPVSGDLIIFFVADERIDFRELIRRLVKEFRMHIVLRQIGLRDQARMHDSCGICGRPLCCKVMPSLVKKAQVPIKAVKEQGLISNTSKWQAVCDRFLCCFLYEDSFYRERKSEMPQKGTRISVDGVVCEVRDVNVVSGDVKLVTNDDGIVNINERNLTRTPDGAWLFDEKTRG